MLIMLAAYTHDLFAWSRDNHHVLSAAWVRSTKHPLIQMLEVHEREQLAFACEEHRSTFTGEYSCQFSELIAAADRGNPETVDELLDRAYLYRTARGFSHEDALTGAKLHIKEKFGHGGYARYPDMYLQVFADELNQIRDQIDQL